MSRLEKLIYGSAILMVICGVKIPKDTFVTVGVIYTFIGSLTLLTAIAMILIYNKNKLVFDNRSRFSLLLPDIKKMIMKENGEIMTVVDIIKLFGLFIFSIIVYICLPMAVINIIK